MKKEELEGVRKDNKNYWKNIPKNSNDFDLL